MDEGKVVDAVSQYFSKAFDTVSQSPSGQDVQWQDKEIQSVLDEKTVAAGLRGLQGMGLSLAGSQSPVMFPRCP